jgi:sigma-E factor negative regulatory protein RseB
MIASGIHNTAGWDVVRSPLESVDMEAEGWQLTPGVPGFRKIHELRRLMAARDPDQPPIKVDQVVFSDGLAAISVFVEPVDKGERREGVASTGATHILVKRSGDFWITLLGEVPLATLEQVSSAIEYKTTK